MRSPPNQQAHPEPSRPREVVLFIVLLLAPFACVATWVWSRAAGPEEHKRLGAEIREWVERPIVRPSHVTPAEPGAFGDDLDAVLNDATDRLAALRLDRGALITFMAERQLLDASANTILDELSLNSPARHVLKQTRRGEIGRGAHRIQFISSESGVPRYLRLEHIGLLVAAGVMVSVERAEPGLGLELCLDGLALARDTALPATIGGTAASERMVAELAPGCLSVFDALPTSALLEARRRIVQVRAGWPTPRELAEGSCLDQRIHVFGGYLMTNEVSSLPAGFASWAPPLDVNPNQSLFMELAILDSWRAFERTCVASVDAAGTGESREAAFLELERSVKRALNPMITVGYINPLRHLDGLDYTAARLDAFALLLEAIIQQERLGRWPDLTTLASITEIVPWAGLSLTSTPFEVRVYAPVPLGTLGYVEEIDYALQCRGCQVRLHEQGGSKP